MITVILLVYEQVETLRAALQCLSGQTYDGVFEVVVCDDGSDADMASIVKDAAREFRYDLKYVWHPHKGFRASASRNNGIRAARGDLLVFLDGDMLVPPTFLAAHAAHHDGSRTLVCGTRDTYEIEPGGRITRERVRRAGRTLTSLETAEQRFWLERGVSWMALLACNFSVPRAPEIAFDEHFRGWGSEDRELAYRLTQRHGYTVTPAWEAEALHVHFASRQHINDPFITGDPHGLVDFLANKLYLRDLYPDADLSPVFRLVSRCQLDPESDRWRLAPPGAVQDSEQVIALARDWFRRQADRPVDDRATRRGARRPSPRRATENRTERISR